MRRVEAGLTDLGENYAAELVAKAAADAGPRRRRGLALPRRGAAEQGGAARPVGRALAERGPEAEGERIARFAPGARVLVQVETTGLPGRNGCPPAATGELVARLGDLGLEVRGLMTVAAPGEGCGEGGLRDARRAWPTAWGCEERSMGMSDDLEAAVAAGSTMVRIGRALFGARPPATAA